MLWNIVVPVLNKMSRNRLLFTITEVSLKCEKLSSFERRACRFFYNCFGSGCCSKLNFSLNAFLPIHLETLILQGPGEDHGGPRGAIVRVGHLPASDRAKGDYYYYFYYIFYC